MRKLKRKYTVKTEFNLRCSTCGEFISKDGGDGMAVWGEKGWEYEANGIKYPGIAPFTIVHKGKCDDKEKYPMSSELSEVFRKTRRKK
tara:strand:- start:5114 stop:5377 length:264 start_codon:yes stop_codon:yes gene_type:complete